MRVRRRALRLCGVDGSMSLRHSLDSVNAKVNGLVNLVNSVNSGTKLIDGIGTQMHLSVGTLSLKRGMSLKEGVLFK